MNIEPKTEVGKEKPKEEISTRVNIGVVKQIQLQLTTAQFNLIGRALSGNMRESEKDIALALSLEILNKYIRFSEMNTNQHKSMFQSLKESKA
jgi:hypothetical protein